MTSKADVLTRFYLDVTNELEVAFFPEDFADWLMDDGRDEDAREFLIRVQHYRFDTRLEDQRLDAVIDIAQDYAPVAYDPELIEVSRPYTETLRMLEDLEAVDEPWSGDAPLSWDREAALVNALVADSAPAPISHATKHAVPVDMDEHEFPDVTVYVDDEHNILDIIRNTVLALVDEGYYAGARQFARDLFALTRRPATTLELFELVWSYVAVLPEFGSDREKNFYKRKTRD